MMVTDILNPACVRMPLVSRDKYGAIAELVDLLAAAGEIHDRDAVVQAVVDREKTRATGLAEGLAIPHGKSAGCSKLVLAVGRAAQPIDFGCSDGKPADLVFLLASPVDEMGPHIQALARISRLWLDPQIRATALAADSAESLYRIIAPTTRG
jgi:mannitol/fructose-specific phosphotransferase system IIA component (Ntr-type)